MKIIFWGTPEFAVPILDELCKSKHNITAIVSQPDKVKGRKKKPQPPEIAQYGTNNNIIVKQPLDLQDESFIDFLVEQKPDIMIIVAYGRILRKKILAIPKYGCINVHFSLLPKYRGASPVNSAILNGDKETGITIMRMVRKMDAGPILCQKSVVIEPQETTGILLDRLGKMAAGPLLEILEKIENNTTVDQKQDESKVSYCGIIAKKDGEINWSLESAYLEKFVCSMSPWPTAYSTLQMKVSGKEERITIHQAITDKIEKQGNPGDIIQVDKSYIWVKTGDSSLKITRLQRSGKAILATKEFLLGTNILEGDSFIAKDE